MLPVQRERRVSAEDKLLCNDRLIESLTAGLKSPPLILKKIQTLTASEKPKDNAIYCSVVAFGAWVIDELAFIASFVVASAASLATCVPTKAKKRNMNVPLSSATKAIASFR